MPKPIDTTIWGSDVRLYNSDLKVSSEGDLDLVTGLDNLCQAIRIRLTSEKGYLISDQNFGVDANYYIGRKNTVEKQEMLKLAIIEELSKEARVASINDVVIVQNSSNPDTLNVTINITPINSQSPITLNLIYPWYSTGSIQQVVDESATSTTKKLVEVDYDIHSIVGVYTSSGSHKSLSTLGQIVSGTNYYEPSGSFSGRKITLSKSLPNEFTTVYVTYNRYMNEQKI